MATHSIKVSINLDGLRGELQHSLQRVIYLVASGLKVTDKVSTDGLSVPGKSIIMNYDSNLVWDNEQAQKEFSTWLLINGFRDSIESVNFFLESAHKVISFWELSKKQKNGTALTGGDWQNMIVRSGQKYHSYGFPDKLDHLKTQHHLIIDDKLLTQVMSINLARNCLVHRNGIVTERDLNGADSLEVKWYRMAVIIQSDDGEKEFIQGESIKVYEGNLVTIRNKEETKQFTLGERIHFSSQEFADITWGLFLFGGDVVMKINQYGLENGFLHEAKDGSA